ncbi:hypothetical protein [Parasitella parasitica]|uniref:Uncharacterized protein n=1 Tax=Parasitella parasitica TaxID=35722 RepID=A0A0B7MPZ3_9FUNG|nr:hypothetical protein [Parasitella parasitica]
MQYALVLLSISCRCDTCGSRFTSAENMPRIATEPVISNGAVAASDLIEHALMLWDRVIRKRTARAFISDTYPTSELKEAETSDQGKKNKRAILFGR